MFIIRSFHLIKSFVKLTKATAPPLRHYRGKSAEERRAARRERLLDAALDVLGTNGWQATTVTAVCERARLTPRYFYESFGDRDEIVVAVFDQVMTEISGRVLDMIGNGGVGVTETLRATAAAFVSVTADDPRKGRVAFFEALGSEALMRKRVEMMRWFANAIAADARRTYGLPDGQDYALELAGLIAAGGLVDTVAAWLAGELKATAEQVIDTYARLCTASLQAALPRTR